MTCQSLHNGFHMMYDNGRQSVTRCTRTEPMQSIQISISNLCIFIQLRNLQKISYLGIIRSHVRIRFWYLLEDPEGFAFFSLPIKCYNVIQDSTLRVVIEIFRRERVNKIRLWRSLLLPAPGSRFVPYLSSKPNISFSI